MARIAITNVRVFDGDRVIEDDVVVVDGRVIAQVGGSRPTGVEVLDGTGCTLLPGLIDSHTHTSREGLALALRFGVTTELEMQGTMAGKGGAGIADDDGVADVRSAGFGITPPGGHPSELWSADHGPDDGVESGDDRARDDRSHEEPVMPFSSTPEEAVSFVPRLAAAGSDYIKFMIDDGTVEGSPGLPVLDHATVAAGVAEAHRLGLITIAHALTLEATRTAVQADIDGLAHLFMDQPATPELVDLIARSGVFVTPCAVLNASMMGITGAAFAADPRVSERLDPAWLATIHSSFDRYRQGRLDDVLDSVRALHEAGVDLLVGTDVSFPMPELGGLAHGASVHHELQLLVRAGLTPLEALRAATAVPARRFGLADRGRIAPGLRADLVLVEGDPTRSIGDTLNLRSVWRRGVRHELGLTAAVQRSR